MPTTAKGVWRHTELEVIQALVKFKNADWEVIAKELNLCKQWVARKLKFLKAADRIYISDWTKKAVAGDYRAIYALKKSVEDIDAIKPTALKGAARCRNYRAKRKFANELRILS